jgi:hypothetical protein
MNSRRSPLLLASLCSLLLVPFCEAQETRLFNYREAIKSTLPQKTLQADEVKLLLNCANQIAIQDPIALTLPAIHKALLTPQATVAMVEVAMIRDMEGVELVWKNLHDGYMDGLKNLDGQFRKGSRAAKPEQRVIAGGNSPYSGGKPAFDGTPYKGKDDKPSGGMWKKLNEDFWPLLKFTASAGTIPITPTAALALDPNQPLLDTFSQLAPNASAWVLAGLDEGVPPNVRQNLTYIREDLLDEYKQKPKASQDAYKLAHQLCSTMITALDERDQTLVRAGFRAVQADANISGTNQALEARRNYMMSWPQYAREQAQRAELIRQGTAGAQVNKALPKVEWSNRTAALRRTLDDLYAQFREALRQSPVTK